MANYPLDNKMIIKVELPAERIEELQALGIRFKKGPSLAPSFIVFFPEGWDVDHKAKVARRRSDGMVVELPKNPPQQLKIDSTFFGVN